jgi:hypothetical protein
MATTTTTSSSAVATSGTNIVSGRRVKPLKTPPLSVQLLTAGAAACVADIFTFPLDTTKVRLQVSLIKTQSNVKKKFNTWFFDDLLKCPKWTKMLKMEILVGKSYYKGVKRRKFNRLIILWIKYSQLRKLH